MMKDNDIIKNIPLFSSLDEDTLNYVQNIAVKKSFPKNTILFSKGDASDALYIINRGKVKALINDENGREIVLSIIGPGEYFGEMSFLDGESRSATVMTKEPTQVLIVYRQDFRKILLANPDIMFNLLKVLLRRVRQATDKIESLALMDVYRRMVNLFLQLAKQQKQKWIIEEKLTHQEIANMIGSSREMVSKLLKELQVGGYISVEKKRITINKELPPSF